MSTEADRLASIEHKLDRLTDVVSQVARQEEKIAAVVVTLARETERLDTLYKDIYGREGMLRIIDRNRWVVGIITFVSSSAAAATTVAVVKYFL